MPIFKTLLITLLLLWSTACEDTSQKQTLKEIALTLIAQYADGAEYVPTIRNYEDAGIIGVNEHNIDQLNAYIRTLSAEAIDTEAELKAIVDALGISLDSDIYPPIITLSGPNPITILLGENYNEPCPRAYDEHDGEVPVYVQGEVNTHKVGTYVLTCSAVDLAGNIASVDRIIHVVETITDNTNDNTNDNPTTDPIPQYTIGGVITGLNGSLSLKHNNEILNINSNGTFTFTTPLNDLETYNVTILSQPTNQTCNITNGSGTISSSDISNIQIVCSNNLYYIRFTIAQDQFLSEINVTVVNTVNDDTTTQNWVYPPNDPNAIFTFNMPTPLATGESYDLIIPPLQTTDPFPIQGDCYFSPTVGNNQLSGVMGNADITIPITCPSAL